jgi:hypothetical protein
MQPEDYDFLGNLSGTWSILLGALLATGGGFVSTQMERYLENGRRERSAALLFGEILSMTRVILEMTHDTYGRGDPFGPVTLRMLRSVRNEFDIYDRNRESLFDIKDGAIRAKIHSMMLRIQMPIDGVFDLSQEIAAEQSHLRTSSSLSEEHRRHLEEHIEEMRARRVGSYEFVLETADELPALIASLEPIAQHSFESQRAAVRLQSGIVPDTTP